MINLSFPIEELEYFLLIFTRVTCFIYIAPFYGMNNTPNRVKICLGVFISFLLYEAITPHVYVDYTTVWQYGIIIMKEALVGLLIGLGANICTSIISFAGRMMDMEMGLSMASLMDPTTKENATITGLFFQYLVTLILITSGMYQFILKALVETYTLIPVNGAIFHVNRLMTAMISFMSEFIIIGFRICLPVFATNMILNAVLGILAKVSPQMNMFAVGMQLKILVGLAILFLTIGMLPNGANYIFTEMKIMMVSFVEAMM
ncbi:MAG TPA: flagellar biosynthetic protein FliR [Lachnospiraceae bacterium]|nr:flagellar biosynthetic protein FliR [Lachnospiraceae bacterium]